MEPSRPAFVPDPGMDRGTMRERQREIAAAAVFEDDPRIPAGAVDERLIAGVDQAFGPDGERAVSAVVLLRGGDLVERVTAVTPLSVPYIPGLLAFREGGPIVEAFRKLERDPDLAVFDGSGRIHFRQAGLATHLGVTFDLPAIGVAKNLLCGSPRGPTDGLDAGARTPIEADGSVEAPPGTVLGYALQTRQYDSPDRHINPVYVSPGHRVGPESAAEYALALCAGYKLPEPIRLADQAASERADGLVDHSG